jgi:hypothetical protein
LTADYQDGNNRAGLDGAECTVAHHGSRVTA